MKSSTTGARSAERKPTDRAVIVSSDTHAGPTLAELRAYCPTRHLDAFDEFERSVNAQRHPVYSLGALKDGEDLRRSYIRNNLTDGGNDPAARMRDLNRDGVAAEVIFHGVVTGQIDPLPFHTARFGSHGDFPDLDLVAAGQHMYNLWLVDFISEEPARHAALAHVPMWDVGAAVRELEWARSVGLRGVNFPRPQPAFTPYNDPVWEPFWSASESLAMPLTTHAQDVGGIRLVNQGDDFIRLLEVSGYNARRAMHYLVFGGVFQRHPGLKLVFTEQSGDWWTPAMIEMDTMYMFRSGRKADGRRVTAEYNHFNAFTGNESLHQTLDRMPSEYCGDNLFVGATCIAPFEATRAVADGYVTQVMWGSDYPHTEGSFQYPRTDDEESFSILSMRDTFGDGISLHDTALMAGENAARVYDLDLATLRDVAEKIDAPTLGELTTSLDDLPADRRIPVPRAGVLLPEDTYSRGPNFCFRRHGAYS